MSGSDSDSDTSEFSLLFPYYKAIAFVFGWQLARRGSIKVYEDSLQRLRLWSRWYLSVLGDIEGLTPPKSKHNEAKRLNLCAFEAFMTVRRACHEIEYDLSQELAISKGEPSQPSRPVDSELNHKRFDKFDFNSVNLLLLLPHLYSLIQKPIPRLDPPFPRTIPPKTRESVVTVIQRKRLKQMKLLANGLRFEILRQKVDDFQRKQSIFLQECEQALSAKRPCATHFGDYDEEEIAVQEKLLYQIQNDISFYKMKATGFEEKRSISSRERTDSGPPPTSSPDGPTTSSNTFPPQSAGDHKSSQLIKLQEHLRRKLLDIHSKQQKTTEQELKEMKELLRLQKQQRRLFTDALHVKEKTHLDCTRLRMCRITSVGEHSFHRKIETFDNFMQRYLDMSWFIAAKSGKDEIRSRNNAV